MRVDLWIVGVLGLTAVMLGAVGCDQSSSNAGTPPHATTAESPTPDPEPDPSPPDPSPPDPPDPSPPEPPPEPDPEPDPDPTPDPQPMPEAGQPDAFEQKLDEVRRLTDEGQTRSALILARMMQQQFAGHPKLNELIALERQLNEQRDLEAKLAVPLRNLGADDPATVRVARKMLRRAGTPALPLLRKLAHQDEAPGSREAMLLLADLGDPGALPMILDQISAGADEELASALRRVAATAGPTVTADLYRAFAQQPSPILADALVVALGAHAEGDAESFNQLADDPQAYQRLRQYFQQRIATGDDPDGALRHAAILGLGRPGLRARFYTGTDLKGKPIADLRVDKPYVRRGELPIKRTNRISARWTGKIRIDKPGTYTFMPTADDGQRVIINGQMIVDDWNMHGPEERKGRIQLEPGLHDIEVQWMQGLGGYQFTLRWQGPGLDRQEIPEDRYRVVAWKGMDE